MDWWWLYMKLDLSNIELFSSNEIDFDKKCTFIYGPNGTGKSTIANEIKKMNQEYDVHVFQGFESVISQEKTLNAVVLGEENVEISKKLEKQKKLIEEKENEIDAIRKSVQKPLDNKEQNYWTRKIFAEKEWNTENKHIEKFYSQAASSIKNRSDPQITSANYTKNHFKQDIPNAKCLSDQEINFVHQMIKTQIKEVKKIEFPMHNMQKLYDEVKEVIKYNPKEPITIARIDNAKKRKFAQRGYEIHHKGDICAFCGNRIKDEVFDELDQYFSVEGIKDYQKQLNDLNDEIVQIEQEISNFNIDPSSFYPEYIQEAQKIQNVIVTIKKSQRDFLSELVNKINFKCKHLFAATEQLDLAIPQDFCEVKKEYNVLLKKNNDTDLPTKQEEAKNKLRLHYVKLKMDEYKFEEHKGKLDALNKQKIDRDEEYFKQCSKISNGSQLQEELKKLKKEYKCLEAQTISETKLVEIINSKLNQMVTFELHYSNSQNNKGIYNIKDIRNNEIRDVTELSTGEKNIIAFLYFIGKLDEIKEPSNKKKIVVFDDPMNSNDDGMQYLIMQELHKLMNGLNEDDLFILLTHNKHFYLNVKYRLKYNKNSFYHFQSLGTETKIIQIKNKKDDFINNYDSLWKELRILYDYDSASPDLLLNPIRRIIETYTKFNVIEMEKFCGRVPGSKKLFDVNSHSIDDLTAELNGKTKEEILEILKECFEKNGAEYHFYSHWEMN